MEISKALIAKPQGPQPLRTTFDFDWNKKTATCRFESMEVRKIPEFFQYLQKQNANTYTGKGSYEARTVSHPIYG